MIKSALAAYNWFVRQVLTGSRMAARKPSGEQRSYPRLPNLLCWMGKGTRLGAEELGLLAKRLANSSTDAAHIKEQLTPGFYGI